MVLPYSDRVSRVPPYSVVNKSITCTGVSPSLPCFPKHFQLSFIFQWSNPRSLATTNGISVDFFSSGYLDVSVPQVRLTALCIQAAIPHKCGGFPHSEIVGSKLIRSSPTLIAAYHVLHRLSMPRHPSIALLLLTIIFAVYSLQVPEIVF